MSAAGEALCSCPKVPIQINPAWHGAHQGRGCSFLAIFHDARATNSLARAEISPDMHYAVSLAATHIDFCLHNFFIPGRPPKSCYDTHAMARSRFFVFQPRQPQRVFHSHEHFSVESGFSKK